MYFNHVVESGWTEQGLRPVGRNTALMNHRIASSAINHRMEPKTLSTEIVFFCFFFRVETKTRHKGPVLFRAFHGPRFFCTSHGPGRVESGRIMPSFFVVPSPPVPSSPNDPPSVETETTVSATPGATAAAMTVSNRRPQCARHAQRSATGYLELRTAVTPRQKCVAISIGGKAASKRQTFAEPISLSPEKDNEPMALERQARYMETPPRVPPLPTRRCGYCGATVGVSAPPRERVCPSLSSSAYSTWRWASCLRRE